MAIRARVERHKCVGAGNCITLAADGFDWLAGDFGEDGRRRCRTASTRRSSRAPRFACPTAAIVLEDAEELLPWQLRGKAGPRAGS
jgi:ferredoxin